MKTVIISLFFFHGVIQCPVVGGLKAVSKKPIDPRGSQSAAELLGDDLKLFPGYLWDIGACSTSGAKKATCCGYLIHQSDGPPRTRPLVQCGSMPRPAGVKMCSTWYQVLVFKDGYQFCCNLFIEYNGRKVRSVDLNCLRYRTDGTYRFETTNGHQFERFTHKKVLRIYRLHGKICRPSTEQQEYFSGHKRHHCVKYQALLVSGGLKVSCSDPYYPGRRFDSDEDELN